MIMGGRVVIFIYSMKQDTCQLEDKSSHYDVIFRSDNIRLGYFPHLAPASAGSLAVLEFNGVLDNEMLAGALFQLPSLKLT